MNITVKKKHPLSLRWNHWVNFPLIFIMIWSGLLIYWANPVYLLPDTWLDALKMGQGLAIGLGWHLTFAAIFTLNGVLYLSFLLITGHWRYVFPQSRDLKQAGLVFLHDLKIIKQAPVIEGKYNSAQKLAYFAVFLFGVGAALTGFAIYKPIQLNFLVKILGGYETARWEHFYLMVLFVAFFLIHIAQVIRAGWNNFRAMITGLESVDEKH